MHIYKERAVDTEFRAFAQDDGAFSFCPLCSFPSASVCTLQYYYNSSLMIHRRSSHKHFFSLLQDFQRERNGLLGSLCLVEIQSELDHLKVDLMSKTRLFVPLKMLKHGPKSCPHSTVMWVPVFNIQAAVKMGFLNLFSCTHSE